MSGSPNRVLAVAVGAGFLLLGILGFTTAGAGFVVADGGRLLGVFEVNGLQNTVHLVAGTALLVAGLAGLRAARAANTAVGVLLLLLGIVGLFIAGSPFDVLALNVPDHVLHFAGAVLLLAAGLGADKPAA